MKIFFWKLAEVLYNFGRLKVIHRGQYNKIVSGYNFLRNRIHKIYCLRKKFLICIIKNNFSKNLGLEFFILFYNIEFPSSTLASIYRPCEI